MSGQPGEHPPPSDRLRAVAAAAAAVLLAAVIGAVLVVSGGSDVDHEFDPAPARCVEDWNGDPNAVALGRHQSTGHGYINVQVLTLSPDYAENVPAEAPGAACAVVFASGSLDPEIGAAAAVRTRRRWEALSSFAGAERLTELQADAQGAYNARLGSDGIITPL